VDPRENALQPHEGGRKPESIFRRRLRKFRKLKRGYWSFLLIVVAFVTSFFLPLLANNVALVVRYEGRFYFPIASYYPASTFGQDVIGEPDYR
jgi:microcin C transport system permease protein